MRRNEHVRIVTQSLAGFALGRLLSSRLPLALASKSAQHALVVLRGTRRCAFRSRLPGDEDDEIEWSGMMGPLRGSQGHSVRMASRKLWAWVPLRGLRRRAADRPVAGPRRREGFPVRGCTRCARGEEGHVRRVRGGHGVDIRNR